MNEETTILEHKKNKDEFLDFLALMILKYQKKVLTRKSNPKKK